MHFSDGTHFDDIRIEDYPIKIEGSVKNIRPIDERKIYLIYQTL